MASFCITQTFCTPPSPQARGLTFLPAHEIFKQMNHILPQESKVTHPLATTKPASHSPRWFTLLPSTIPCGLTWHVVYKLLWELYPPSVSCHVFSHLVLFRVMNSSFGNWVNRKWSECVCFPCWKGFDLCSRQRHANSPLRTIGPVFLKKKEKSQCMMRSESLGIFLRGSSNTAEVGQKMGHRKLVSHAANSLLQTWTWQALECVGEDGFLARPRPVPSHFLNKVLVLVFIETENTRVIARSKLRRGRCLE